jgi:hypothetical protein
MTVVPFSRSTTDRPRQAPKSRLPRRVFSVVSVSAVVLAPVAAATLWLLISDPVTAAGVVERGDLLPVLAALAKIVGKAISAVMAAL